VVRYFPLIYRHLATVRRNAHQTAWSKTPATKILPYIPAADAARTAIIIFELTAEKHSQRQQITGRARSISLTRRRETGRCTRPFGITRTGGATWPLRPCPGLSTSHSFGGREFVRATRRPREATAVHEARLRLFRTALAQGQSGPGVLANLLTLVITAPQPWQLSRWPDINVRASDQL